jgi:hypothetical protein
MIEYKAFLPESFKSTGNGSAQFVIATTGLVDSDGDVLIPGAVGQQVSTLLPTHNWNSVPLGKAWISERGNQVIADVQFNPTPEGQSWYHAIKWDYENPPAVQQYSWGYTPEKSHPGEHAGQRVRFLEAVTIHETSPVVVGASRGTLTAGVKQHDMLSPFEWSIIRAARREADDIEAELKEKLRSMAQAFHASEESIYADRVAVESNEAMGHITTVVPAVTVSATLRSVALVATKLAAKQLNTKTPELRWFTEPDEITLYGRALPSRDIIYLNDRLTPAQSLAIAAHEVGHCAGLTETECRAYEGHFLKRTLRDTL